MLRLGLGMGMNSVCSRKVLSRRNDSRGEEKRRGEKKGEKARDPRPRRGRRHVFFSTVVCTHETVWWWWSSILSQVLLRGNVQEVPRVAPYRGWGGRDRPMEPGG